MHNVVMMSKGGQPADSNALDLARMLCLSPTAFSYWDRELQCWYANSAFADWFGVNPEILIGSNLESVLEILRLEAHFELAEAALHGEHRSIVHSFHAGEARRDGLVQYVGPETLERAEVAVVVADAWRRVRVGLGAQLLMHLERVATAAGVEHVVRSAGGAGVDFPDLLHGGDVDHRNADAGTRHKRRRPVGRDGDLVRVAADRDPAQHLA